MRTICIAGKNNIAVDVMLYCINHLSENRVICITDRDEIGINTWQKSLSWFANKNGVEIVKLEDVYDIKELAFISTEFDRIIKPEKFKSKTLYNIHFSLLPKYKGVYTCVLPVLNGDSETGVTLHKIRSGIDTGEIIDQEKLEIKNEDTSLDVYQKLNSLGTAVIVRNLAGILADNVEAVPQDKEGSTYYSHDAIDYKNLYLNVNCTAFQIQSQIRAFSFRPYQILGWNGNQYIQAQILDDVSILKPGCIIEDNQIYTIISSIDYDIKLYKDVFYELLEAIKEHRNRDAAKLCSCREIIKSKDKDGWTALTVAVYNNNKEMTRYLIERGANIYETSNNGGTLLMYAKDASLKNEDWSIFRYLLSLGLKVEQSDYDGISLCDNLEDKMFERIPEDIRNIIKAV